MCENLKHIVDGDAAGADVASFSLCDDKGIDIYFDSSPLHRSNRSTERFTLAVWCSYPIASFVLGV